MKKNLLSVLFFFLGCILCIEAQTLYGTTSGGGKNGGGAIIKFVPATNNLTVAKSFEGITFYSGSNFIQASNGKLYGTALGGSMDYGVIFSFDPSSLTYTKLRDFDNTSGGNPYGSLLEASDGKLYGTTSRGGSMDYGVIFSFDPSSSTYTKLRNFDNTSGAHPNGGLIEGSDGKLYGMTSSGGNRGEGVIFSFDPSSLAYTKVKEFDGRDGAYPFGSLIPASDGKLYGMTGYGGNNDFGVIFSFDPTSSAYTKLKEFDGYNDGANPNGNLIQASDGKLYGMIPGGEYTGDGFIFSFDPSSSIYARLTDFDNTNGHWPNGSLIQANDGMLYGMASRGGSTDYGVIFSFDPASSAYAKLKEFDLTNGGIPNGSLLQARDGKLYGMAGGGSGNYGVIFSLDPPSSTYTKLKDFNGTNGVNPIGSLIADSYGKLYGVTYVGGKSNDGVIYSFDPSSSTYQKLKDFDHTNGFWPCGSLVHASDGKLYGMTTAGGSSNGGIIFSFDPSSSIYAQLKDFDITNGMGPYGSLVQASDGKLYGSTTSGGSKGYGYGVLFSFDPSSSGYTKLKEFGDGARANGSLIQATDGKLYGMSRWGGNSDKGFIFSYDPSSSAYRELKEFDGNDGADPDGNVVQASDGKLYGMTSEGGSGSAGVIFSYDPSSSTYTKLKDFDSYDLSNYPSVNETGGRPFGSLMQASDGRLYGMTSIGGSRGFGVIFSFDPSSSTYTKLKDFNGANGARPGFGSGFNERQEPNDSIPPTLSITTPINNATYLAPAAHIKLSAASSDTNGLITKVEFYNGETLLHTETVVPYGFVWRNVPLGSYTLTAKAYDHSGLTTTSDAVHISVIPNKPPTVSIIAPLNNEHYAAPAYIHFEAAASNSDGRITRVEFYNGSALLRTEYKYPYTYVWKGVPTGTYTITAVAIDNWGDQTTSAQIVVKVKPETEAIVSSRASVTNRNDLNDEQNLKIYPNPANQTLNIYTKGLQQNKPATISIISASGIVLRKMPLNTLLQTIQLDITSLVKCAALN